jgi:hypothetical protein
MGRSGPAASCFVAELVLSRLQQPGIITGTPITEIVTATIVATDTEATDSDEYIHPNGFTSGHIVAGKW